MLSRVAAVKAPRTHSRRRVTGSSGRRREGRESEPRRPNMSRRVFTSAVLLLLVGMMCCATCGATQAVEPSSEKKSEWKDANDDGVTVESFGVPGLLNVGNDVFVVAEAQCKKDENKVFTGIASQLLTKDTSDEPMEVLNGAKDKTQVLEEGAPTSKRVDVSRPTTVVDGGDIYMLVGKYSGNADARESAAAQSGILLVKGTVSGEESNKQIDWKDTNAVPTTPFGEQLSSLTGLIGGGGSGVKMKDGTLVFPVEGTKEEVGQKEAAGGKTFSLLMYTLDTSKKIESWKLSKGMSADGCSDPSVVEWEEGKLMMMTACGDGRRRVYEIGEKGESWTEALGTLSRVWSSKQKGGEVEIVGSGFITANIGDGVEDDKRNVMLITLPVYSENVENGVLHLWLTDNTHIVDIGPVSGNDDDVAASALLYKSGDNNEELIALYEKKKGDEKEKPSPGMVSVRLTEQLQRVKDVLATWKKVDEHVSQLCTSSAEEDTSTENACNTGKITDGLVGFLSGNFSDGTWRDEYLGVNATVTNGVATGYAEKGVRFTGSGAGAEWPVGKQGENQLYHFANYNFTLVATVSIHGVPRGDTPIPLIGAKMNDSENPVLLGLSYDNENKWRVLCGGENTEHSSNWETETQYQVAIVLHNGSQGSAYVDGQRVGNAQLALQDIEGSKGISHFYIGGDGGSAEAQEGVPVTVKNVLLYNRPLDGTEITTLAKNQLLIRSRRIRRHRR
ncbi:c71 surface protein, partial [Trypanosoma cruzi]